MPTDSKDTTMKSIQAGLLTWILPGAGHFMLGHRRLALVFFVAISFPYLTGLAVGGVVNSVNPRTNKWLFLAELGVGGYTVPGYLISQKIEQGILAELNFDSIPPQPTHGQQSEEHKQWVTRRSQYVAYYPESDMAQIYLATAGLLNLLAILDAISRAQTGGLPTFHRELEPEPAAASSTPKQESSS
ncbi:MAG: hypothetical protein KAY37_08900 [Phycisphaerae bacterium]|nr:hypothetical protein [Phycisphaerae bacterium]